MPKLITEIIDVKDYVGCWGLMFQCFEKLVECFVGIALCFIEQGDELGTDDGSSGILLGRQECLLVADAEAYHAWIVQVHLVDAPEVLLLLLVETLLGPGDGSRRYHVDEPVGMVVNEADALLTGLGGDEHDDAQVVAVGHGFDDFLVVLEGKVRNDHTADTTLHARLAEGLYAILHDGVEIAHENERDVYLVFDCGQLLKKQPQCHTVLERTRGSILNDRPVGHGVTERDAYFDHGDASPLHGQDDVGCAIEGRGSGTEIEGEQFLLTTIIEKGINLVHCLIVLMKLLSWLMSLTAGDVSKRELRSMPANSGWWNDRMRGASSGPMPPLSRNGVVPL